MPPGIAGTGYVADSSWARVGPVVGAGGGVGVTTGVGVAVAVAVGTGVGVCASTEVGTTAAARARSTPRSAARIGRSSDIVGSLLVRAMRVPATSR